MEIIPIAVLRTLGGAGEGAKTTAKRGGRAWDADAVTEKLRAEIEW